MINEFYDSQLWAFCFTGIIMSNLER